MANNPASEERKLDSFDHSSKSIRRKRTEFNKEQINILVKYFAKNRYPGIEEREHLSRLTNIPESRIQVWFQNRRARHPIQSKKRAFEDSTNSRKRKYLENVPLNPFLERDFSKQNLVIPSASSCLSWAGELDQETGPKSSCFFERRSAAPTTENACMDGYGISPNSHFVSSQTMRPTTEFQPGDLSRAAFQGSSKQWPFSWALQETKGSKNYGSHTFFCGERKSPMQQQQRCTSDHFYPCYDPVPFQYTQEPSHQPYPQKHPLLQQLTPSQHQSSQEFQGQTQGSPLVREKEQQNELLLSCKQQELNPINLYKKTVGCGSTLFLHDRHVASSMGDVTAPQEAVAAPQGHQTDHQGDVAVILRDLAAFLGGVTAPQGHLTYHQENVDTLLRDLNALLGDLNAPPGRSNYPTGVVADPLELQTHT